MWETIEEIRQKPFHEGIKYWCDQCDKLFTELGSMKKHIQSVHEGVMFLCDKCYYQASEKGLLKKHDESVHEGVKYHCG